MPRSGPCRPPLIGCSTLTTTRPSRWSASSKRLKPRSAERRGSGCCRCSPAMSRSHMRTWTTSRALEPGRNLIEAIAEPLLAAGLETAGVTLEGGSLRPFTYVIPAPSTDARYAAYYSAPFTPSGETRIEIANLMVGRRDALPFLHCHGIWIEADGARRGGHPIPDQTFIASAPKARAWGVSDVALRSDFDPETNFTLFHPVVIDRHVASGGPRTVVARIR